MELCVDDDLKRNRVGLRVLQGGGQTRGEFRRPGGFRSGSDRHNSAGGEVDADQGFFICGVVGVCGAAAEANSGFGGFTGIEVQAQQVCAAGELVGGETGIGLVDGMEWRAPTRRVGPLGGNLQNRLLHQLERLLAGVGAGWLGGSRKDRLRTMVISPRPGRLGSLSAYCQLLIQPIQRRSWSGGVLEKEVDA